MGKKEDPSRLYTYKKASTEIQKKHPEIKNIQEYRQAKDDGVLSDRFPKYPPRAYAKEWEDWATFLGSYNRRGKFADIETAAKKMRKLGLRSNKEFYAYIKSNELPEGCPRSPTVVYRDEFTEKGGWKWYLGNETMSYEEAVKYIRKVKPKIDTFAKFREWADSDKRPKSFPSQPHSFSKYKDVWVSYPVFLGTAKAKKGKSRTTDIESAEYVIKDLIEQFPELKKTIGKFL